MDDKTNSIGLEGGWHAPREVVAHSGEKSGFEQAEHPPHTWETGQRLELQNQNMTHSAHREARGSCARVLGRSIMRGCVNAWTDENCVLPTDHHDAPT